MSIFYPAPSSCSPLPPHTASHPLLQPTYYSYYYFSPTRVPLKKFHYVLPRPDLRNESVTSGFDGSLPPLVYRYSIYSFQICSCSGFVLQNTVWHSTIFLKECKKYST